MKGITKALIIFIAIVIIIAGFDWYLYSYEKDQFSIIHTPIETADTFRNMNVNANVTGGDVLFVKLNYTDVKQVQYILNMNSTGDGNFRATIPYQTDVGNIMYNIWAKSTNNESVSTPNYTIQVFLDNNKASTIVKEEVVDTYSDRSEIALYHFSPTEDLLHVKPLFEGTLVSNLTGFSHTASTYETLFYIPVLFSNDTALQTCVFVNKEDGNYTVYFFKGDLYVNNTKILSSELYGNITVTSIQTPESVDYQPIFSNENALSYSLEHIKNVRGEDTQTSIVICSNPVEWERDNITAYYWVYHIPNLHPGVMQQYEFHLTPCDSEGTSYWDITERSLYASNNGNLQKITFTFYGTEDFVQILFFSPLI